MRHERVSLGRLLPPALEMREVMTMEGLDELADSMRRLGLKQPILVRPEGEKLRIIAGARRHEAAKRLQWDEVDVLIEDVDEHQEEEIKIHENLKREDVDPVEEAHYYKRLHEERGWTVDDLVKATGRTLNYLEGRMEIARWDSSVKAAISARAVPIAVGREVMRFPAGDVRLQMLQSAAQFNATARVVRSWYDRWTAEQSGAQDSAGAEGPKEPAAVRQPHVVFCEFCGEDTSGMVVHWVPVSQQCLGVMHQARADYEAKKAAAARVLEERPVDR